MQNWDVRNLGFQNDVPGNPARFGGEEKWPKLLFLVLKLPWTFKWSHKLAYHTPFCAKKVPFSSKAFTFTSPKNTVRPLRGEPVFFGVKVAHCMLLLIKPTRPYNIYPLEVVSYQEILIFIKQNVKYWAIFQQIWPLPWPLTHFRFGANSEFQSEVTLDCCLSIARGLIIFITKPDLFSSKT